MMLKYFSEKVSPGVHDVAAKKEAFAAWNGECIHHHYAGMREEIESNRSDHAKQIQLEHAVHKKTRGDMLIKYFSEKVNPGVHDVAAKKEVRRWNAEMLSIVVRKRNITILMYHAIDSHIIISFEFKKFLEQLIESDIKSRTLRILVSFHLFKTTHLRQSHLRQSHLN
jgi:hypothetical protein